MAASGPVRSDAFEERGLFLLIFWLRLKTDFLSEFNLIPSVQMERKKYSAFRDPQIIGILCASRPT